MNEPSNFCNGVCVDNQKSDSPLLHQLPYIPTGSNFEAKTLSLDATHKNGVKELDAHSLYGSMETKATHEWF
jgi:alpha-glucosidase (family GH31 glycosyl hydrolase)